MVEALSRQHVSAAQTCARRRNPGQYLANGARAKSGLNRSISDAGWGRFVSILRAKAEEAGRIWVEVDPRHTSDGCEKCGHAARENRVTQADFVAKAVVTAPRPTNTPHVTSYGLDWPITRKPREKKPADSSRQRSHQHAHRDRPAAALHDAIACAVCRWL